MASLEICVYKHREVVFVASLKICVYKHRFFVMG